MFETDEEKPVGRRFAGIAAVLLLHALIVYGLVNGLGQTAIEVLRLPITVKVIEAVKPPPPAIPPPPPPKLAPPPPSYIPLPEIVIAQPQPPKAIMAVTTVMPPVPAPPQTAQMPTIEAPPAPPVPVSHLRVPPVIDAARSCRQPDYPAASRRHAETGTVVLDFLIGVDGRVIDSKIKQSSGYDRLDEAARQAMALCQFKPGTVDGQPEPSWAEIAYEWKIQ